MHFQRNEMHYKLLKTITCSVIIISIIIMLWSGGTNLLRIAICDDMPDFLARANSLVSAWKNDPENVIIELFSDGDSLIDVHIKNPFDIILLDIVMPLMNGIDTAAQIRKNDKSVKLVFLTSSPEFAIESYSVQANGYLLKPIDKDKLYSCLDHLYSSIADNTKYIMIKDAASVHRIELRSIEYAESQGKHVIFTLYDSSQIKSSEPFYVYNDKLTAHDGFFKCHRSYIVNIFRISKYTPKEITMRSGCRIPISRNAHKDFEAAYFELTFTKVGDV
ncbi:MAG: response regulator transcription factor [Ruminococcaceae bacterium]|nr:response regulator transcription factor [Oscillospiraceae bacterium]